MGLELCIAVQQQGRDEWVLFASTMAIKAAAFVSQGSSTENVCVMRCLN